MMSSRMTNFKQFVLIISILFIQNMESTHRRWKVMHLSAQKNITTPTHAESREKFRMHTKQNQTDAPPVFRENNKLLQYVGARLQKQAATKINQENRLKEVRKQYQLREKQNSQQLLDRKQAENLTEQKKHSNEPLNHTKPVIKKVNLFVKRSEAAHLKFDPSIRQITLTSSSIKDIVPKQTDTIKQDYYQCSSQGKDIKDLSASQKTVASQSSRRQIQGTSTNRIADYYFDQ